MFRLAVIRPFGFCPNAVARGKDGTVEDLANSGPPAAGAREVAYPIAVSCPILSNPNPSV